MVVQIAGVDIDINIDVNVTVNVNANNHVLDNKFNSVDSSDKGILGLYDNNYCNFCKLIQTIYQMVLWTYRM